MDIVGVNFNSYCLESNSFVRCTLKKRQCVALTVLISLFILGTFGTILMWMTNTFDTVLFMNLAIRNNSFSYNTWKRPISKPLMKMFIFNYTNVGDFENGIANKLQVQEIGPYVYEESLERVNIRFHTNLISYQEKRTYRFLPELSFGHKLNDRLQVPNIPMLAVAATNKHSNLLTRLAISSLLNGLRAKTFIMLPAHRFILGYEDDLYTLSKSVLKLQNKRPYEKFGLLAGKLGTQNDVVTINSGSKDVNRLAFIESINGKSLLDHWSTNECNALNKASDGSMFEPQTIRHKHQIHYYFKEICRTMPLTFQQQVMILDGKVPAYRYVLPYNVFDTPKTVPNNQCYCNIDLETCPLQGVFNVTPCAFGAPTFFSFPHFYNADNKFKYDINGLNLNHSLHQTYADIHPTLGYIMTGKTRLQLNVQIVKSFGISQLNRYSDDLMLPVFWFELALEEQRLPKQMVDIIFRTTFTIKVIEICLKYTCLIIAIVTFLATILWIRNYYIRQHNAQKMYLCCKRKNTF